jgi:hypothetical protein
MLLAAWGIAIFSSFVPIENGLHNPSLHTLENLTLLSEKPQCLFVVSFTYAVTASKQFPKLLEAYIALDGV